MNGRYQLIQKDLSVIPKIPVDMALETVLADLKTKTSVRELNEVEKNLLEYKAPIIDTIIYTIESPVRYHVLAYGVFVKPNLKEQYQYFIDANSGKILHYIQQTCSVDGPTIASAKDLNGVNRQINTYLEGSKYLMLDASQSIFNPTTNDGVIVTLDATMTHGDGLKVEDIVSSNNQWNTPTAISAHFNAHVAYNFYKNNFGRESINGSKGSIISVINIADDDGSQLDNAYWNGKAMFYGNGNTLFKPLAGGLDVGGHEMTHGVVQNSANLEYQGESGAINESMADVFGFLMDSTNWQIGESVVNKQFYPSGALRDLQNPHNGGNELGDAGFQPMHVTEQYRGTQDNGGVHINSGIPNHAFYLFASAIGKSNAAAIYYDVLTKYLTQNSQFIDLRLAVIQSTKDHFGDGSAQVKEAAKAFDAVGIVENGSVGDGGTSGDPLYFNKIQVMNTCSCIILQKMTTMDFTERLTPIMLSLY